eukprot:1159175-Pelagomonas_calceolata.AAC.5
MSVLLLFLYAFQLAGNHYPCVSALRCAHLVPYCGALPCVCGGECLLAIITLAYLLCAVLISSLIVVLYHVYAVVSACLCFKDVDNCSNKVVP